MPLLYSKAKQKVDEDFQKLIDEGFTPVLNADRKTYSWVDAKGNKRRDAYSVTNLGLDAEAGGGDIFRRGHRQRRLMSEKATAYAREKEREKSYQDTYQSGNVKTEEEEKKKSGNENVTTTTNPDALTENEKTSLVSKAEALKTNWTTPTLNFKINTKPSNTNVNKKQNTISDIDESGIGLYTARGLRPSDPYVYMTDEEAEIAFGNKNSNTISWYDKQPKNSTIIQKQKDDLWSSYGVNPAMDKEIEKEKVINGKTYRLRHNPDFTPGIFTSEKDAKGVSKGYFANSDIRKYVGKDGITYYKVEPTMIDQGANLVENLITGYFGYKAASGVLGGAKTKLVNRSNKGNVTTNVVRTPPMPEYVEVGQKFGPAFKQGGKLVSRK